MEEKFNMKDAEININIHKKSHLLLGKWLFL